MADHGTVTIRKGNETRTIPQHQWESASGGTGNWDGWTEDNYPSGRTSTSDFIPEEVKSFNAESAKIEDADISKPIEFTKID